MSSTWTGSRVHGGSPDDAFSFSDARRPPGGREGSTGLGLRSLDELLVVLVVLEHDAAVEP